MSLRKTIRVINEMVEHRVIESYAICGAVAALNYIEPTLTDDLDILVAIDGGVGPPATGLVTLEPIFAYLRKRGYTEFTKQGIVIEGWPVQFLPLADDLDAEGLEEAAEIEIERGSGEPPVKARILHAEHVVATALRVGRAKDLVRISQLLEERAVDLGALCKILERHNLRGSLSSFCRRSGIRDPCAVK